MSTIRLTACTVDLRYEQVHRQGETVPLTSQEAEILRYLADRPEQVVSREELSQEVLDQSPQTQSRAIDAAIGRLRAKLERDPAHPRHLMTVRGVGYRLVAAAVRTSSWLPEGVVDPEADAADLLGRARSRSDQRGDGFVGLEHLVWALADSDAVGDAAESARAVLRGQRFGGGLAELSPAKGERRGAEGGTPRLGRLLGPLPAGFDEAALWRAVIQDPGRGLFGLDREWMRPGNCPPGWGEAPARALEVVGGPEDGLRLSPAPGARLGRWWPGRSLDHGLYQGTLLEDDRLSRSGALVWDGPGAITPIRAASVVRWSPDALLAGATRGADGEVFPTEPLPAGRRAPLRVGDLLLLTPATCLRAL